MIRRPPRSTLFPLHDALPIYDGAAVAVDFVGNAYITGWTESTFVEASPSPSPTASASATPFNFPTKDDAQPQPGDRKSTRLNSSHANISYAVFCLKKTSSLLI